MSEHEASWYHAPLARVHDTAFFATGQAAARTAHSLLPDPAHCGLIVELGCGSGVATRELAAAGYQMWGVDISPSMIELAKAHVPAARFEVASIYDVQVPPCQAVLAIGEIFNYETGNRSDARLGELLRRVANSLRPDGFLLFDVSTPGRIASSKPERVIDTADYTMWTRTTEDPAAGTLTRHTVTFARTGEDYRRSEEVHVLRLLDDSEVTKLLRQAGLAGERLPGYDGFELNPGWSTWLARPASG